MVGEPCRVQYNEGTLKSVKYSVAGICEAGGKVGQGSILQLLISYQAVRKPAYINNNLEFQSLLQAHFLEEAFLEWLSTSVCAKCCKTSGHYSVHCPMFSVHQCPGFKSQESTNKVNIKLEEAFLEGLSTSVCAKCCKTSGHYSVHCPMFSAHQCSGFKSQKATNEVNSEWWAGLSLVYSQDVQVFTGKMKERYKEEIRGVERIGEERRLI